MYNKNVINRKRKYDEINNYPGYEINSSDDQITDDFSNLTINKKLRINSNDEYIEKTYLISNQNDNNAPKMNEKENKNSKINMEHEKVFVEEYYEKKNKELWNLMFGNK
jgi:hypothetical protein